MLRYTFKEALTEMTIHCPIPFPPFLLSTTSYFTFIYNLYVSIILSQRTNILLPIFTVRVTVSIDGIGATTRTASV
jgi:hypothetical protein